jgi:hypothetical protein
MEIRRDYRRKREDIRKLLQEIAVNLDDFGAELSAAYVDMALEKLDIIQNNSHLIVKN